MRTLHVITSATAFALMGACGGPPNNAADSGADDASAADAPSTINDPACQRGTLEPDIQYTAGALADGGTVDPGAAIPLPAGTYTYSTTYLRLTTAADGQQMFHDRSGAILAELPTQDGLLGYTFGSSSHCLTARTFTIWRDEASMYRFVSGAAHVAAMSRAAQISRGGSAVTAWSGDETAGTWQRAEQELGALDGGLD